MSIRDRIRQADGLGSIIHEIPEWEVKVEIRSMSARQRAALQTLVNDEKTPVGERQEQMWQYLLTNCCYDPENGEKAFQPEDVDWLMDNVAFEPIDRLATACLNISAVLKGASDELGKSSSASPTKEA